MSKSLWPSSIAVGGNEGGGLGGEGGGGDGDGGDGGAGGEGGGGEGGGGAIAAERKPEGGVTSPVIHPLYVTKIEVDQFDMSKEAEIIKCLNNLNKKTTDDTDYNTERIKLLFDEDIKIDDANWPKYDREKKGSETWGDNNWIKLTSNEADNTLRLIAFDTEYINRKKDAMRLPVVLGVVCYDFNSNNTRLVYNDNVKPKIFDDLWLTNIDDYDYKTGWTKLTYEDLKRKELSMLDVVDARSLISDLFTKNTYLVGHGLHNDLVVLRIFGPKIREKIIDTTALFKNSNGTNDKLKNIVVRNLLTTNTKWKDFQSVTKLGHDPLEDAEAPLQLILNRVKECVSNAVGHAAKSETGKREKVSHGIGSPQFRSRKQGHSLAAIPEDEEAEILWEAQQREAEQREVFELKLPPVEKADSAAAVVAEAEAAHISDIDRVDTDLSDFSDKLLGQTQDRDKRLAELIHELTTGSRTLDSQDSQEYKQGLATIRKRLDGRRLAIEGSSAEGGAAAIKAEKERLATEKAATEKAAADKAAADKAAAIKAAAIKAAADKAAKAAKEAEDKAAAEAAIKAAEAAEAEAVKKGIEKARNALAERHKQPELGRPINEADPLTHPAPIPKEYELPKRRTPNKLDLSMWEKKIKSDEDSELSSRRKKATPSP